MAVHPLVQADGGDEPQEVFPVAHPGQKLPGGEDGLAQGLLLRLPAGREALGVRLEGQTALHHVHAGREVMQARHFDAEAEAVQQLGPQFPLFGVHGAHQDEAGRVGEGDALPLHHVDPHGRGIQEHVHQMVVQQVHFIDIEDAAVGCGQQTRFEMLLAALDGALQVDGAEQPVLGGAERQVHHRHGALAAGENLAGGPAPAAVVAHQLDFVGVAVKRTARHHRHGRQQFRQPSGRGGLGRALLAADQDPGDEGIDGIENQGLFETLLPDQGGEGIDGTFGGHGAILPAFEAARKSLNPFSLKVE